MALWRAVATVPSLEFVADRSLRRLGVTTFFPRRIIRRHRRGSPKFERAYFQGYVFADLESTHAHVVVHAQGVLALVGNEPIPGRIMDELMSRADPSGLITDPLIPGAYYQLDRPGALGKVLVQLERIDECRKARVLLRLLGLDHSLVVPTTHIIQPS